MDLNLIKKLIKIVETSEITEFSVQEGELKVRISKNPTGTMQVIQSQPQFQEVVKNVTGNEITKQPEIEVLQNNYHEIKSPIVGTFYRAPAPDADPYVQVGQSISKGAVLCIVEAMKLMNEIESDISGKIVKILVENATPVEYNQPLFLIETE